MKTVIFCIALSSLLLSTCVSQKPSPLFLTILVPHNDDTVKTLVNPVEGKAYPAAQVSVGFAVNSPNNTTLVPDDTGRFIGTYTIPTDETGDYGVFITAAYGGVSITETRTVHYIHQ
jgi:hypothetical protein